MSAKILSSLSDENRTNLRKQIGCINGIFQIFDRRHLISAQRLSSTHNQTRQDLLEQNEKQRASLDSSPRHYSSESETQNQRINTVEKPSKIPQSPDLRDVVKGSMYRDAHSIKAMAKDEQRQSRAVKHIDSPRPLRSYSKYESNDNNQQMTLARFSCDERVTTKHVSNTSTRLKELPRLSLDSRASSAKFSSSSETRTEFLDRFRVGYVSSSTEPENHRRSSSVVARLMGLESFPEPSSRDENHTRNSISKTKETLLNISQSPTSPSPRLHRADCFQDSRKMAPQSIKAAQTSSGSPRVSSSCSSPSVYGEIEKRVAELEFKKSDKDLRALKQILEAMQRTREMIEKNQREQSAEASTRRSDSDYGFISYAYNNNNSNFSAAQNRKIKGLNHPKAIDRAKFTGPTTVTSMDVLFVQRLQNLSTKQNHKKDATSRRNVRVLEPNNYKTPPETNGHLSSINKKGRDMDDNRNLKAPRGPKGKSCINSGKGLGISSSRFQQNMFHGEESSRPVTASSEPCRIAKHSGKKLAEGNSRENKKHKLKSKAPRLRDDVSSEVTCSSCQGNATSQRSESNYSVGPWVEEDNVVEQKYVKTRREQMSPVQLEEIPIEQPSPVSVLDAAFCSEDPPSPVSKITLAFQEDGDASSDEVEYPISESSIHSIHKNRFSNRDQRVTSSNHDASLVFAGPSNSSFSRHLISPEMFHALETESAKDVKSSHANDRKIILDVVNEILYRKIASDGLYTAPGKKRMSPQDLIKEVYLELNCMSSTRNCNFDDEDDDGILKLLASGMKYESEDWTTHKNEVPPLVLDIERLIFKDLINEVLTSASF